MKERIQYIDAMRGFAILLVVIAHLVQYNYEDAFHNDIFNSIYSFHMPLFFFISGCVSTAANGNVFEYNKLITNLLGGGKRIVNKALALLLPSVIWTLLVPNFFSKFEVGSSLSKYWFLNTLFAVVVIWDILVFFSEYIRKSSLWLYWCTIGLGLLTLFVLGMSRFTIMYFSMFIIGHLIYRRNLLNDLPMYVITLISLAFLMLVPYFHFGENASGNPGRIYIEFVLSILASILIIYVFSKYQEGSKIIKALSFIGQYTLGIYVCHFYFLDIPLVKEVQQSFPLIAQFVLLSVIAFIICLCCVFIQKAIQPITYLYKAMYGKFKI